MPKISEYSEATDILDADLLGVQDGTTRRIPIEMVGNPAVHRVERRTGNITFTLNTGFEDVPFGGSAHVRPMDLVVPGVEAGDRIVIVPEITITAATGSIIFTMATIVDGARVRDIYPGPWGAGGWSINANVAHNIHRPLVFYVQTGDIENGAVRVRLQYWNTSSARTINADEAFPCALEAHGPFKPTPTPMLLIDGQSFAYAPPDPGTPLAMRIQAGLTKPHPFAVINVSGTTYDARAADAAYRRDLQMRGKHVVLLDIGGTSDILADMSAATILGDMEAYHTAAKAAGAVYTVASTVPPATGFSGGQNTIRDALNDLILGSSVWDAVVDLDGIPESANAADTDYYYDGLHPTDALAAIWATEILSVLAPFGIG